MSNLAFVLLLTLVGYAATKSPVPLAEASAPPTTNVSADKIFDDFSYAVTSQNWTAAASLLHPNVTALLTDASCLPLCGSSAVLKALQDETSNAVVESINRQSSVQSNASAMICATVTGFAASNESKPWWIFEPMALFTMRISPDSGKITDFRRYVPNAGIRNASEALYLQAIVDLFQSIVEKNGTAFASLFSKTAGFRYVGHPEGQGFPIDEYSESELVNAVVSRFPITTHDAIFTPTIYTTCDFAVVDASQLAWYAPPTSSPVSLQETSANIFTFDSSSDSTTGSIVKWERWYWNNISMW